MPSQFPLNDNTSSTKYRILEILRFVRDWMKIPVANAQQTFIKIFPTKCLCSESICVIIRNTLSVNWHNIVCLQCRKCLSEWEFVDSNTPGSFGCGWWRCSALKLNAEIIEHWTDYHDRNEKECKYLLRFNVFICKLSLNAAIYYRLYYIWVVYRLFAENACTFGKQMWNIISNNMCTYLKECKKPKHFFVWKFYTRRGFFMLYFQ